MRQLTTTDGLRNIALAQGLKGGRRTLDRREAGYCEAIAFAKENGVNVIHSECVLMFLEPLKSVHALHRWMRKVTGTYAGAEKPVASRSGFRA